jgi:glycosyltransferase involved in cell wall biosynthesis
MKQRPVALILPSFAGGGAERVALAVAGRLNLPGLSPVLIPFVDEGPLREAVPAGVQVLPQGISHRRRPLALVGRLAATLTELNPAAALSFTTSANLIACLARRRSPWRGPLAVGEHSDPRAFDRYRLLGQLLTPLIGSCYRSADAVVVVSRGLGGVVAAKYGVPPDLLRVIHNGIDLRGIATAARRAPDHPFFAPGAPPVIVAGGRLIRRKGFSCLVDAWARLRREIPCRLIILGEGPERERLLSRIGRLGLLNEASLPGFVGNPWAWYAGAGVVAAPSLGGEGFLLVVAEAMASGAPVVTADCDFGPGEIVEEGISGLLVPPGDCPALAAALRRVLTDPGLAAALREGGRRRAEAFSEERMLDGYRALIRDLTRGETGLGIGGWGLGGSNPGSRRRSS